VHRIRTIFSEDIIKLASRFQIKDVFVLQTYWKCKMTIGLQNRMYNLHLLCSSGNNITSVQLPENKRPCHDVFLPSRLQSLRKAKDLKTILPEQINVLTQHKHSLTLVLFFFISILQQWTCITQAIFESNMVHLKMWSAERHSLKENIYCNHGNRYC